MTSLISKKNKFQNTMQKFGSYTSEKEAKNSKMIPKMLAMRKDAKKTKRNEAKFLAICFANRSKNHAKQTAFRFHFA
jgi:hypothetical protein